MLKGRYIKGKIDYEQLEASEFVTHQQLNGGVARTNRPISDF